MMFQPKLEELSNDMDRVALDSNSDTDLRLRVEPDMDASVRDYPDEAYGKFSKYDYDYMHDGRTPRPDDMDGRAEKLEVARGYWCWWQSPDDVKPGTDEYAAFRSSVLRVVQEGFWIVTLEVLQGEDYYSRPIVIAAASLGGVDAVDGEYLQSIVRDLWAEVSAELEELSKNGTL